jgi:hypothetical protein
MSNEITDRGLAALQNRDQYGESDVDFAAVLDDETA